MMKKQVFSGISNVTHSSKKASVTDRLQMLNKLAASVSRKDVELELKRVRSVYNKAMQNYERTNKELSQKQQEVDSYQAEMNEARQKLVDLGNQVQTMDLTGADGVYSAKDEVFYVLDGKRFHVDRSDITDVKMTPYKEWRAQNGNVADDEPEDENNSDDCGDGEMTADISLVDDIFTSFANPRFN